jgi:hypothetical protein
MKKWYRGFLFWMAEGRLFITSESAPNVAWIRHGSGKCSFQFETAIVGGENYYQVAQSIIDEHWVEKGC